MTEKELTPLEALERLTKIHNYETFKECYNIIETALKDYFVYKQDYERVMKEKNSLLKEYAKSQKKLKALEIIKVEMPNLTLLASCKGYERYKQKSGDNLTRKEYDLLKEVLNNENSD